MARDGIDATVMYGPIVPLLIKDPELRQVCYRAYNEWLAEFCAHGAGAPDRRGADPDRRAQDGRR
jgi:hypothetical protein